MDHIEEAKVELARSIRLSGGTDAEVIEAEFGIKVAQTEALLSIAESLAKLAGAMDVNGNLLHVMALTMKDV